MNEWQGIIFLATLLYNGIRGSRLNFNSNLDFIFILQRIYLILAVTRDC